MVLPISWPMVLVTGLGAGAGLTWLALAALALALWVAPSSASPSWRALLPAAAVLDWLGAEGGTSRARGLRRRLDELVGGRPELEAPLEAALTAARALPAPGWLPGPLPWQHCCWLRPGWLQVCGCRWRPVGVSPSSARTRLPRWEPM